MADEIKTQIEQGSTPKKRGRKAVEKNKQEPIVGIEESKENMEEIEKSKENEPKIEQSLLSDYQLTCLKRCLGWNEANIPRVSNNKSETKQILYSYRNRYFTNPKPDLEDMVTKGIFEKGNFGENGIMHEGYRASEKGMQFLEEVANIRIIHVRKHEDVYEPVYIGKQDNRKLQR